MKSTPIQPLLLAATFALSLVRTLVWLAVPLIVQVIVDKVILQNAPDTLSALGSFAIAAILTASALEFGLAALTRRGLASFWVQLAAKLPKVLVVLGVVAFYSPQLAKFAASLTGLACIAYYLLQKRRIRTETGEKPPLSLELLPLSFRLPLSLFAALVFWNGATLVLARQLTLGQWLALCLLSFQFAASLLNLTAAALSSRQMSLSHERDRC